MPFDFNMVDEREIKREKEKARRLRRTNWWYSRVQKGECYYCGQIAGRENLTMDHVVPLIRGGKSRKGNLVAACKECNSKKKYLLPLEWEVYLKDLAKRPA